MRDIEHKMQCACVRWFRYQYPELAGLLFAIPNGGARNAATGRRLKDEGVLAGVADMFLSVPAKGAHGLYIELKTLKGVVSDRQKVFADNVVGMGYMWEVCRTFDDFRRVVTGYLCRP